MTKLTYDGPVAVALVAGRNIALEPGCVINVTADEAAALADHPHFTATPAKPAKKD